MLHIAVWAFFVACILAIPLLTALSRFRAAAVFVGVVGVEVTVLVFNGMRCPLTDVAARYTSDRQANFDIYLPEWLAKYNKHVFGALYCAGLVFALARWASAQ